MNYSIDLPHLEIIQELSRSRKLEVHLVGGCLRDFILGRKKPDFDFAVSKNAIALARAFADKIKGAFVLLDKENGCARVVKKINDEPVTYDFADFRAKTFKEDLRLRDFAINTLSIPLMDIKEGMDVKKIIRDHQSALKDIKSKKINLVAPRAFKDDPLRMLRAYSLRAIFDFKIAPKTIAQIKKDKDLLREVSIERVRDELFKIFESEKTDIVLKEMDKIGLLEKIIPQLRVMYGVTQGGYHHLDVWNHTLEAVKQLEGVFKEYEGNKDVEVYLAEDLGAGHSRKAIIKFAILLHDIGKPDTRKKEEDRFSFHGHEHVGRNITRAVARHLRLSRQERFSLEDMVLYHLRPGYLSNFDKPTERMIYRYFRDTKKEAAAILILSMGDQRATRGPMTTQRDEKHHEKICKGLIDRYFADLKKKPFVPLITGHTLIKELKLKPSPLFGKILSNVSEQQSLGKVSTKKQALELARILAEKG